MRVPTAAEQLRIGPLVAWTTLRGHTGAVESTGAYRSLLQQTPCEKDRVPGRNQSFISLGGDSITAIRLAARSAENGLPLTVQDVLSAATIAELGAIADSRPQAEETTAETNGEESSDLSGLSSDDLSKVITAFGDNRE